ncbi:hypothetical protein P8C59_004943 [Phyllachora maydis]|uniref:Uncharacterized protein n=1 Tax=Phyllachora maydis TaxID=1825666 RepID=A0AAD9I3X3_9PEZI|nr:hypothetical protein P8C59_004943 [Phyllachora maydis]
MAEEGAGMTGVSPAPDLAAADSLPSHRPSELTIEVQSTADDEALPTSPRAGTPNPWGSRRHTHVEVDDYFTGPRDILKHSKWPVFLQMHGSILPKMILPLIGVGLWSTLIMCISHYVTKLSVNSVLLTITGFVVSLGLSLRSSTAYERYGEGRRYWASLIQASQALGRVFWVHTVERVGEQGERDMLAKLSALNLLVAFAVALKHRLRYEPYTNHDDIASLVAHLDTYAQAATRAEPARVQKAMEKPGFFKSTGQYLGISFAASNPRKAVKGAGQPLGNMPLEILSYLASYIDETISNGLLPIPMQQTLAYNNLAVLNDVLTGTERVLTTPLPIAYAIAIAQITWVYILLLPFQLIDTLGWITIPASVAAAYIILGLLFIGHEVENPFGQDVNDLPLDDYCAQVAAEMDVIASHPKRRNADWIETVDNRVLWPLSQSGWPTWRQRGGARVRQAVQQRVQMTFETTKKRHGFAADSEPVARRGEKRGSKMAVDTV